MKQIMSRKSIVVSTLLLCSILLVLSFAFANKLSVGAEPVFLAGARDVQQLQAPVEVRKKVFEDNELEPIIHRNDGYQKPDKDSVGIGRIMFEVHPENHTIVCYCDELSYNISRTMKCLAGPD